MDQSILNIWVGYDEREAEAYDVCRWSLARRSSLPVTVRKLELDDLVKQELYWRGWTRDEQGRRIDNIDGKPFSTDFTFSRFLVPALAKQQHLRGLAVFVDADFLWLRDIQDLLWQIDPDAAVSVVKHQFAPMNTLKMDGQAQQNYEKKLWSSLMVFNLDHGALGALTPEYVNSASGSELHQFKWLPDELIGSIDEMWNWVPGHSRQPSLVERTCSGRRLSALHYTNGLPLFDGYENCEYAGEWLEERAHWKAFNAG
jgi:hypothetical protein